MTSLDEKVAARAERIERMVVAMMLGPLRITHVPFAIEKAERIVECIEARERCRLQHLDPETVYRHERFMGL